MKKILFFILASFFCNYFAQPCFASYHVSFATEQKSFFAKVENANTFFYSTPQNLPEYQLFEIPVSYFVLLTNNENQDFFCAEYKDLQGYVLKDSVCPVNEVPQQPYANSSFRVFVPNGTNLYDYPLQNSNIATTLPQEIVIADYYGKIAGDSLVSSSTNIWYYSKIKEDNIAKKGYVFSYFCDEFEEILQNREPVTKISGNLNFTQEILPTKNNNNDLQLALIIIGCTLPVLLILYIFLSRPSIKKTQKIQCLKKPKKDYYEFNPDDI